MRTRDRLMRLAGVDRVLDEMADRLLEQQWVGHDPQIAVAEQLDLMIAAL